LNLFLLKRLLVIAAVVLAAIWLLSATSVISSSPDWLPPASVLALALAVILP
jgi:hypothetical protein